WRRPIRLFSRGQVQYRVRRRFGAPDPLYGRSARVPLPGNARRWRRRRRLLSFSLPSKQEKLPNDTPGHGPAFDFRYLRSDGTWGRTDSSIATAVTTAKSFLERPSLGSRRTRSSASAHPRVRINGKFFARRNERLRIRGVTYGPFAPNEQGEP